jgi:EmrB/QacA subfamily drug resistance transporter
MFEQDRKTKLITLGTMCFALFMVMLDNTVVNLALATIAKPKPTGLGASLSDLQWIVDGYVLFIAALLLTGGTIGDLYGRRKAFAGGLFVFTAGSMACALSPSLDWLIAARCLQGAGAAVMMPTTLAILTSTFRDPKERAQAIGMWAGISGLALALGPVIGGTMVDALGWQSIFWINVPVGVIALVCAALFVPESSAREGRGLDIPGQLLAIVGLASLTYAFIEANTYGWTSARIVTCFAVAAVALSAFFVVELRSKTPMLQLSFFRDRTFTGANLVALVLSFGFFGLIMYLALFLQRVLGASPTRAGLMTLPMSLSVMVTAIVAGRIVGRIGSRLPIAVGLVCTGASLLALTQVQYDTPYSHFWFLLVPIGIGNGLVMSPMTTAIMSTVPVARAGMASATSNTMRQVGSVFGVAVLGSIIIHIMKSDLQTALAALHLPQQVVEQVTAGVSGGGGSAPSAMGDGTAAQAIGVAVRKAYTNGFHVALLIAGLLLLIGSPVSYALIRMRSPHEVSAERRAAPPSGRQAVARQVD